MFFILPNPILELQHAPLPPQSVVNQGACPQFLVLSLFSPHTHIWIYQGTRERVKRGPNVFAFGHGKGKVDGLDALLKGKIQKEQIKPQSQRLHNAHDVVMFCREQIGMVIVVIAFYVAMLLFRHYVIDALYFKWFLRTWLILPFF